MRKTILSAILAIAAVSAQAKDIRTLVVTTSPKMHCESCENKIKGNLRFEKGIKAIETSIPDQTVTITYDADKNQAEKIIKAFGKFGYEATSVDGNAGGGKAGCGKQSAEGCAQKNGGCAQPETVSGDCSGKQ